MRSVVVDTNVLIFDTFEDSEFHHEASMELDSVDKWYLPSIVFHELAWFFRSRNIELSRTKLKIEEYLMNEKTVFSPCTIDDIRFVLAQAHNYNKYNDLIILSAAKRLGLPILTFDSDLKKSAAKTGVLIFKI